MRLRIAAIVVISVSLFPPVRLPAQTQARLTIDLSKTRASVSPVLYGLMTEEINYSYDGGLYAELVRNRTFHAGWIGVRYWFPVEKGGADVQLTIDPSDGPSEALPHSAKLSISRASPASPAGVLNEGYWGMGLRPHTSYRGSFYARSSVSEAFPVKVALVKDQTGDQLATADVQVQGRKWSRYSFSLQTGAMTASANNHLEVTVDRSMALWLQLVSLFPPTYHDRPNGNRIDIMEKLAAMHPAFLRVPGGNYLEGGKLTERFDWKKTIGPLVDRPTHQSPWGYPSSDGMGLLEFLEWCEDLRMQLVLAVFGGYALNGETVKAGPALQPYVQDALDEIEFVTGGSDTKWGAVRAENGHPQPFPLRYVEIGNEDFADKVKTYDGRFAQFYKAIKAKYPQLQVIATDKEKGVTPDVIDDHYYHSEKEMFAESHHYDKADRKGPKVFIGEWATREGTPTTNLGGALGDAAFMTGIERNADLIVMASYAPLFVNVNPGGMQWSSDLIGYDALTSYGSPSYYAQTMFSSCVGDVVPEYSGSGGGDKFFYSVTSSSLRNQTCIKLVNASSDPQPVSIRIDGTSAAFTDATVQTLAGRSTRATNTILEPEQITPQKSS